MNRKIRELLEEKELETLSPFASFACKTKGREHPEEECDIRTCFMRDRDRIVHCKSFRRLKDKTQVFLAPKGDHYRTRMMHTLEVSQTARTVSAALGLNSDLVEAIALGHDLGHTPFGHAGERALNEVAPEGFRHYEQSLRIVTSLEYDGRGMNLTKEVRDGILNHGMKSHPSTLEGQIVRFCDKISYVHHDMDDAIRAGILEEIDIPSDLRETLGQTTKERLNTFIHDMVAHSLGQPVIRMSREVEKGLIDLRSFMFERLYSNPVAKGEEKKAREMLLSLYEYYVAHPEAMTPDALRRFREGDEPGERVVCDYISGMTDSYSIQCFSEIFVPKSWNR